ncbi:hypothetical protein Ciccas_000996 [Cichlidogyrus casuarinus]|uniref:Kinesin motor domain-containing protein n=1 Tax=Cichlidogyrus casuarinus TaxID=1844966 RepID=A0ABD2QLD0_9PLAT
MVLKRDVIAELDEDVSILAPAAENIRCYLRIKKKEGEQLLKSDDCKSITLNKTGSTTASETFSFTHIFNSNINQLEIFSEVVSQQIDNFLIGKNELVFTYGTTSSGKTFTLLGNETEPGIVPHSLIQIFQSVNVNDVCHFFPENNFNVKKITNAESSQILANKKRLISFYPRNKRLNLQNINLNKNLKITEMVEIWISFAEIYNDLVYDLLDPSVCSSFCSPESKSKRNLPPKRTLLELRSDRSNSVYVKSEFIA